MRRKSVLMLFRLIVFAGAASAAEQARVSAFSPQDPVKKVRQARATFSEAMVPFGDPGAAAGPFIAEYSEEGSERWADPRNWVYDFGRDLPAGIRCVFRLKPGLRSLAGKALGPQESSFSTGGPAILMSLAYEGNRGISEDQILVRKLEAVPNEGSVLAYGGFVIPGLMQRIGARIVAGEERQRVLDSSAGCPPAIQTSTCCCSAAAAARQVPGEPGVGPEDQVAFRHRRCSGRLPTTRGIPSNTNS